MWPPVTEAGLHPSPPVHWEMVAGLPVCSWEGGGISWAAQQCGELLAAWQGSVNPKEAKTPNPECLFSLCLLLLSHLRLFVRHGKYVQFVVPGVLGEKGWREGQPDPCLGHVSDPCMGTLVTLVLQPPRPRGDDSVLGGAGGWQELCPLCRVLCTDLPGTEQAVAFQLDQLSQGDACHLVPFQEFSAECQRGSS